MREVRRNKKILIFLGIVLCLMTVGYAAFYSRLDITGTSSITNSWDVEITNVSVETTTGNGENAKTPTWNALTASMEANVYESGDSVSYTVTISNLGTLDAKLDEITKNIKTNNEAVKIDFSGYTKGERLYKYGESGSSKTITVTISFNDDYSGELDYNTSTETSVMFNYVQADGNNTDPDNPIPNTYLITYDYEENGGTSSTAENEYYNENTEVILSDTARKEGYTFVGWNTDKDAQIGLSNIVVDDDITLYAIFEKNLTVTYEKGENVTKIGENSDTYNEIAHLYNKETSKNITLPTITSNLTGAISGWYKGNDKIGNSGDNYTITEDITLLAKAWVEPIMMSGPNFQTKMASVKSTVTAIEFIDLGNTNLTVPTPNNTTSWDVSDKQDGSVIAWLDGTKLYIGGQGGVIANQNLSHLFYEFDNLVSITFNDNFDTSKTTDMSYMFAASEAITTFDLSSFDTSKVTNMSLMFAGWNDIDQTKMSLTSINLSSFDTNNVTTMEAMFFNCGEITTLDISNFDTHNVTNMREMFNMPNDESAKLETIIFGDDWNTSKVTNMGYMFCDNVSLTDIDLTKFDTSKVIAMDYMFSRCKSLTELNLNSFDTGNVENIQAFVSNCSNLKTIYATEDFVTTNITVSTNMFYNDINLVGGNGTIFDSSKIDKEYAKIDKENQSGYFTDGTFPIIDRVNISASANSISLVVESYTLDDSEITKYEFSNDGGNTWIDNGTNNVYQFTGLNNNTTYSIYVRVTSSQNKQKVLHLEDDSCPYQEGKTWNFPYTGGQQTFTSECYGTYSLEAWGAQGGNVTSYVGGKGGYATGNKILNYDDKLYIYVGGKGITTTSYSGAAGSSALKNGGYNGGGSGNVANCNGSIRYGASGGGATHFATKSDLLKDLSTSPSAVLLVGGGGGGAFRFDNTNTGAYGVGGVAGGLTAPTVTFTLATHTKTHYAGGGSQSAGGIGGNSYSDGLPESGVFGQGGNYIGGACSNGSGGGSGYYGGGSCGFGPGAGGSSYIGGVTNGTTKAGSEAMPKHDGTTGTMTGNTDDGYARISLGHIDNDIPTKKIPAPTYDLNKNVVVVSFPIVTLNDGTNLSCDNGFACFYTKDNGERIRITSESNNATLTNNSINVNVPFNAKGVVLSEIYDYEIDSGGHENITNILNSSSFNFLPTAATIFYDNSKTHLDCNNVQCALDEIKEMLD